MPNRRDDDPHPENKTRELRISSVQLSFMTFLGAKKAKRLVSAPLSMNVGAVGKCTYLRSNTFAPTPHHI